MKIEILSERIANAENKIGKKQLTWLVERVSILITDMPDVLKGLQEELVER